MPAPSCRRQSHSHRLGVRQSPSRAVQLRDDTRPELLEAVRAREGVHAVRVYSFVSTRTESAISGVMAPLWKDFSHQSRNSRRM
eukprot:649959-Prorocentrum_minimum.AAC.8